MRVFTNPVTCTHACMHARTHAHTHECTHTHTVIMQLVLFTVIYVNFSQATYSTAEADGMMIITVEANDFSIWPYSVEINPMEILPVGGPGKFA